MPCTGFLISASMCLLPGTSILRGVQMHFSPNAHLSPPPRPHYLQFPNDDGVLEAIRWRQGSGDEVRRPVQRSSEQDPNLPHSPQALGSNARICPAIRGECSIPVPLPPPPS